MNDGEGIPDLASFRWNYIRYFEHDLGEHACIVQTAEAFTVDTKPSTFHRQGRGS